MRKRQTYWRVFIRGFIFGLVCFALDIGLAFATGIAPSAAFSMGLGFVISIIMAIDAMERAQ